VLEIRLQKMENLFVKNRFIFIFDHIAKYKKQKEHRKL
jgi:hypothetical protein